MAIGLDVGQRHVTMAVVEGSAKLPRVTMFAQQRIPYSDDPQKYYRNQIDTIQDLMADCNLTHQPVHMNLAASHCMIREVSVPFTQQDQIDKTIHFTVESHLHGVTLDDVLIDYHVIDTLDASSKVMVVAAPKKKLRQTLQMFEDAMLEVPSLGLDCFSFFNTLQAAGYTDNQEANLFLDLGAGECKMMLVDCGTLKLIRAAKVGNFTATRIVAKSQRTTPESIEDMAESGTALLSVPVADTAIAQMEQDEEEADPSELASLQQEYLEKVASEITRTALRINLTTPIQKVYLCGGGSRFTDATEFFSERLNMDVELLDLYNQLEVTDKVESTPEQFNASAGMAIGAALRGLGVDAHRTDFRRDEFRYERRIEQIQKALVLACILLIGLFGLLAAGNAKNLQDLTTYRQTVEDKQREVWLATFGEEPFPGLGNTGKEMSKARDELRAMLGDIKEQETKTSVLDLLMKFLDATRPHDKTYRVISVRLNQKNSKIITEIQEPQTGQILREALIASGELFCKKPNIDSKKNRDGKFWQAIFEINFKKKNDNGTN